jgi:hypothetical protein
MSTSYGGLNPPPPRKPRWSDKQVIEKLREASGVITDAARLMGQSHWTLRRRISKSARLQQSLEEIRYERSDMADTTINRVLTLEAKAAQDAVVRAANGLPFEIPQIRTTRWLKGTEMKRVIELSGPGGSPIPVETQEKLDLSKLDEEEVEQLEALMLKASRGGPSTSQDAPDSTGA